MTFALAVGLLFIGVGVAGAVEPAKAEPVKAEPKKADAKKERRIEISVTDDGFEPTPIKVKKGEPLKLVVTRRRPRRVPAPLPVSAARKAAAVMLPEPVPP